MVCRVTRSAKIGIRGIKVKNGPLKATREMIGFVEQLIDFKINIRNCRRSKRAAGKGIRSNCLRVLPSCGPLI